MAILFYIFSVFLIIGSLGVIFFKKPVHSVLSLIFCFLNCAGIFILLKAEFLAMLLIIVYVGAVSVLFLFVIMMIGDQIENKNYSSKLLSFGFIISFIFFCELLLIVYIAFSKYDRPESILSIPANLSNTEAIGSFLYTEFTLPFEICSIILLVAMVGSVALTHRVREGVRKQNIKDQLDRNPKNSINLVKIESGKSIYDN